VNSKDCGHIFRVYSDLTHSIQICRLRKVRHIFGRSFFGILSKDIRDEGDHIIAKINLHVLACVQVIWKIYFQRKLPYAIRSIKYPFSVSFPSTVCFSPDKIHEYRYQ
jgi:hypothetical protein